MRYKQTIIISILLLLSAEFTSAQLEVRSFLPQDLDLVMDNNTGSIGNTYSLRLAVKNFNSEVFNFSTDDVNLYSNGFS